VAGLPVLLQDGTNTYVYGLDLISATDEDGVQTYYFSDGLGSTTTVADAGGGVVSECGYDVFGELRGQSGVPDDVMLFTGEQYDAKARHDAGGLYYLRARYYDPAIGRFMSQDPIPSANLYAYVGNNPVRFTDPRGLYAWEGGNFDKLSPESLKELEWWLVEHGRMRGHDVYVVTCLEDGSCLLHDCHGGDYLRVCTEIWVTDSPGLLDTLQSVREFFQSCTAGVGGIVFTIATTSAQAYAFYTGKTGQPPDPNVVALNIVKNAKKCSR